MQQLIFSGMKKHYVNNKLDHLKLFVDKAWLYRNDWEYINQDAEFLLEKVIRKYKVADGEQIIRPIHFELVGGDCDNQLVYLLSYFFYMYGYNVSQDLYLVTVKFFNGQSHIYLEFFDGRERKSFDALPRKYHYTNRDILRVHKYQVSRFL